MKTFLSIAAAAAAAVAFSAPAAAQDQATAIVDVSDLDPQRDSAEIDRRVAQAAKRVCGRHDSRALTVFLEVQTCRSAAIENARRR